MLAQHASPSVPTDLRWLILLALCNFCQAVAAKLWAGWYHHVRGTSCDVPSLRLGLKGGTYRSNFCAIT